MSDDCEGNGSGNGGEVKREYWLGRAPYDHGSGEPRVSAAADPVVRGLVNHTIFHKDSPVRGVRHFRRDVIVEKQVPGDCPFADWGPRGVIEEFSFRARYRLLHWAKNCDADFRSMLTLTYPAAFPGDGVTEKRDKEGCVMAPGRVAKVNLDRFLMWFKYECKGVKGLWFLEFQQRGAPHFHLLVDVDLEDQGQIVERRRTRLRGHRRDVYRTCLVCEQRAGAAWYRIVGSGDEKHLRAGVCWEVLESSDAAQRYAAMHAAKPHKKEVPENYLAVGKFWGKFNLHLVGGEDLEEMTTEELFARYGAEAMSSKGRVKKQIWDVYKP